MSATKIAASFRVSLMALAPKPDHRSQVARAWPHVHAALIEDAATGRAGPAFGREPSRAAQILRQSNPENNSMFLLEWTAQRHRGGRRGTRKISR